MRMPQSSSQGEVKNGRSVSSTADVAREGDQRLHRKPNNGAKIDSMQNRHGGVDESNNTKGGTSVVPTPGGNRKTRNRKRMRRERKERARFLNSGTAFKERIEANRKMASDSDIKRIRSILDHDSSRTGVKSHSSLPAEERSRKKPLRRITPTKIISPVTKKESGEHEIDHSKKTNQSCSVQEEEELVSFSSKFEERLLLPGICRSENGSSPAAVKRDSSNDADSAMAEERRRKEARRRIKPTKVDSLDSKETGETRASIQQTPEQGEEEMVSLSSRRGVKRDSSLSVERESDADSTMTENRRRKRRQRRRKPTEDVSPVNEKESGEHKINDSNETIEIRDDKKMETCSIQQKPDQGEEEMVPFSSNNEEFQLPRISIWTGRKKLLVLDLNGLLLDVVAGSTHSYRAHIKVNRKSVFKRPFCDEFIDFCFEKFDVGVWSSRTRHNLDHMVDFLFGERRRVLLFCWDQTKCTQTGFKTRDNKQKPLVLKELSRLWSSSTVPWRPGHFSPSNTLLIDDSPYKALCNPPHTSIFPRPYSYMDSDDDSLGPGGDLRVYLEGLAAAADVQDYVSRRPFGQQPILPDSPSWGFYSRIIQMMNIRNSSSAAQASALSTASQNS